MADLTTHLKQITPPDDGRGHRHSYNLSRWIRRHGEHGARIYFLPKLYGATDEVSKPFDPATVRPHLLVVGTYWDNGAEGISGAVLSFVLGNGAKAGTAFYLCKNPLDVTDILLPRYVEVGKCAFDPMHTLYPECWEETQERRVCRWCGRVDRCVKTPKTVIDVTWEEVPRG